MFIRDARESDVERITLVSNIKTQYAFAKVVVASDAVDLQRFVPRVD